MTKLRIKNILKKLALILSSIIIFISFIIFLFLITLQVPYIHNLLVNKGLEFLNDEFKTEISVGNAKINWSGKLVLSDVKIKDNRKFNFIEIKEIDASINYFKLIFSNFNTLKFDEIHIKNPNIQIITYKDENQDNFTYFIDKFDDGKPVIKESTFQFLSQFDISEGKLSIKNYNLKNPIWLEANNLNISANDLITKGSKIWVTINKLNFNAKKNNESYRLNQLGTNLEYSKKHIKFSDLVLETQSSLINGNLEFTFNNPKELSDFNNKVKWNAKINPNSFISSKDIRYFSDDWDSDSIFNIQTKIKGTLNDLKLYDVSLKSNKTYAFANILHLKNIVANGFNLDSKSLKIQTSNQDLTQILPSFLTKKLKNYIEPLQIINFNGTFGINSKKLYAIGDFNSALGIANIDLKMSDYSGENPEYQAKIKTNQMNISSLIKNGTLQNFAGEFEVSGKGFDLKNNSIFVKTNFNEINIINTKLENIFVEGNIKNQIFTGKIISNSIHNKLNGNAIVDFSTNKVKIKSQTEIEKFYLYTLNFSENKQEFVQGLIDLDLEFSNIKDIKINTNISNFILNSPIKSIILKQLNFNTNLTENGRSLLIDSPSNINLKIDGKYNIDNLTQILKDEILGITAGYSSSSKYKNEEFSFDLDIYDSFLDIFIRDISLEHGTKISGNYSGINNEFNLNLSSPKISYQNFSADNLSLIIKNNNRDKSFNAYSKILSFKDKFIHNIYLDTTKQNDSLFLKTKFYIDKNLKSPFNLNLYQTKNKNYLNFGFLPSTFIINNTTWLINPDNQSNIAFGNYNTSTNQVILNELFLSSEKANIKIGANYKNKEDFKISTYFENVLLDKLIPQEKLGDITLKGLANGIIDISKQNENLDLLTNFKIENLTLNDSVLGNLTSDIKINPLDKSLDINTLLINDNNTNLSITGKITHPLNEKPILDLKAEFDSMKTELLGGFLKGIISDVKGLANGEIKIKGNVYNPDYDGFLMISKFGFKVDYLGVNYIFDQDQEIRIYSMNKEPNNIGNIYIDQADFHSFESNEKRNGSVSGVIQTINFTKWFVNLDFSSENLMVLNTNPSQNELFYGKVYAKGNFSLHGFTDNLSIFADAKALEGSALTLNTSNTSISSVNNKILVFKKEDNIEKKIITKTSLGFDIDFKISVDETSKFRMILDETTGDEIQARGFSPSIHFQMDKNGNISMNGKYEVKQGSQYHFKTLLDKIFTIESGSTINWIGNPYEADLNIIAIQTKQVSNAGDFLQISNVPVIPIDLKVKIKGKLSEPLIDFEVRAPKASQSVREEIQSKFETNPELEKNQFGLILLTGKFYTDNNPSFATGVSSSAYEVAMRQLVNFLNNISPDIQFDLDVTQRDLLSNTSSRINTSVSLNLNSRIKIKSSVGVPIGTTSSAEVNNQLTAEGEIEYDISKKNNHGLILRAFSRPTSFGLENYNFGFSQLQSYGTGIVFRKSFNNFRQFLGVKKDKEIKKEEIDTLSGN